jgi:hypothetical protein
MGILHRCVDARVAHQFFHGGEVNTGEHESRGECVAEVMKAEAWDASPPDRSSEGGFDGFDR